MHRLPPLLAVGLCLSACAAAEPEVRAVEVAGRAVIEEIALPVVAGAYRLDEVEDFGRPNAGSVARYVAVDSLARLPRIDVIVYPAHHGVDAEAAIARRGLMEYDRRSRDINRTQVQNERRLPLASGDSIHAVTLTMDVRGSASRSLLYLHRVGNRFLKVRTTFPLPVGAGPDPVIDQAVEAIFNGATPATGARVT